MQATFYYRARTPEGLAVTGSMAAESVESVLAHLRTRALFVTAVTPSDSLRGRLQLLRGLGGIRQSSLVAFFRSFATMLSAGVSMQRVLTVAIAQSDDRRLQEALHSVLSEIESGRSLSAALRTRPREFPALYVALVEAGESGGMLDVVLDRLATMLERGHALRRRIAASLAYPGVVLAAALFLIVFLMATIVPTFGRMFSQLDVPVPATTQALIAVGSVLSDPRAWLGGAAGGALVAATLLASRRSRALLAAAEPLRFKIPLLGAIQRRAIVARIARTLGSLLRSGVDVLKAVDIVTPLAGSGVYSRALGTLSIALREGDSIAEPLERSGAFDAFTVQMIRVGEESGALDAMLLKVAEHYEAEVEAAMLGFSAIVEPLLIFFVGLIVAGIVFSVFIPMYSLVGQIH